MSLRGLIYQCVSRLSHRFNWHHTRTCYPDGDTLIVCDWCGLRYVARRRGYVPAIDNRPRQARATDPANPVGRTDSTEAE